MMYGCLPGSRPFGFQIWQLGPTTHHCSPRQMTCAGDDLCTHKDAPVTHFRSRSQIRSKGSSVLLSLVGLSSGWFIIENHRVTGTPHILGPKTTIITTLRPPHSCHPFGALSHLWPHLFSQWNDQGSGSSHLTADRRPSPHGVKSRLMLQHPHRLTGYQFKFTYIPRENQLKVGKYRVLWLPRWLSGKRCAHWCRRCKRCQCNPWVRKLPWRRKWQPTPVFFLGKFHEQRSLVGYSPWGHKDLDTTEHTHIHLSIRPSIHPSFLYIRKCTMYIRIFCIHYYQSEICIVCSMITSWGPAMRKHCLGDRPWRRIRTHSLPYMNLPSGRDNRYVYR